MAPGAAQPFVHPASVKRAGNRTFHLSRLLSDRFGSILRDRKNAVRVANDVFSGYARHTGKTDQIRSTNAMATPPLKSH